MAGLDSRRRRLPHLWVIGYITALMTAFYMFRLIYLTFCSKSRMSHEVEHHIHESPKSMTVPLVILAFCSIFAGFLAGRRVSADPTASRVSGPGIAARSTGAGREGKAAQLAAGEEKKSTPAGPNTC